MNCSSLLKIIRNTGNIINITKILHKQSHEQTLHGLLPAFEHCQPQHQWISNFNQLRPPKPKTI